MGKPTIRDRVVELRRVPAGSLRSHPDNWRTHPDAQKAALAGVLADVGWADAVVAREKSDGSLELIDGHLRASIAPEEEVPVLIVDLNDEEAALVLATHDPLAAMAEVDAAAVRRVLASVETENSDVQKLLAKVRRSAKAAESAVGVTEEKPAAKPKKPTTKLGDVWTLGGHRLMCGDSTRPEHVKTLLGRAKVDLVLTDPPYCSGGFQESGKSQGSVGTTATHRQIANDRLSTRGYKALLQTAIANLAAPYVYAFTDWRMWVHLFDLVESLGYGVRSMICWDKGTPGMGRGWRAQHELILWGCKVTPPFDKHASGQGNVIGAKRTGNKFHTTEKPVDLVQTLLLNTPFAQRVADPFAGSGTTLIACEDVGRQCYAMELDPVYCDTVVKRWESFTGKKAKRKAAKA